MSLSKSLIQISKQSGISSLSVSTKSSSPGQISSLSHEPSPSESSLKSLGHTSTSPQTPSPSLSLSKSFRQVSKQSTIWSLSVSKKSSSPGQISSLSHEPSPSVSFGLSNGHESALSQTPSPSVSFSGIQVITSLITTLKFASICKLPWSIAWIAIWVDS